MGNNTEKPQIINGRVRPERTHPPLRSIRLLPGSPFYDRQKDMLEFLAKQDTDSMLYNFRKASGLPTGDANPMTGWDSWECKLRGHTNDSKDIFQFFVDFPDFFERIWKQRDFIAYADELLRTGIIEKHSFRLLLYAR